MELKLESFDAITIATVPVDALDGSNDGELKAQLFKLIESHKQIVLDLSQVQFIDSTGCGAMIAAVKQLRAQDGDLKLCCITKPVKALFRLIGLKTLFGIYSTREEALESFVSRTSSD